MMNTLHNIESHQIPFIRRWFIFAISALGLAGLFALPPVILRAPVFEQWMDIHHVFAVALVIHVDLSVVFWMLSISGLLWCIIYNNRRTIFESTSPNIIGLGILLVTLSAFVPGSEPIKNNYIPILHNIVFLFGLALFTCGMILQIIRCFLNKPNISSPMHIGALSAITTTIIAFICFMLAHHYLPDSPEDRYSFYEALFWGGGHILQFTFTTSMMMAWLYIASYQGVSLSKIMRIITVGSFIFQVLVCLPTPFIYLIHGNVEDTTNFFTQHMWYVGGIAPTILGLAILAHMRPKDYKNLAFSTPFLASLCLFLTGGILGLMITGSNAVIPSHYHGSIIGITIAFMGLCYHLLGPLGSKPVSAKWITIQMGTMSVGQMAHILGLAIMGGYGALRKAAGSSASIDTTIGKILFFSGGSLAILGGFLFILLMITHYKKR